MHCHEGEWERMTLREHLRHHVEDEGGFCSDLDREIRELIDLLERWRPAVERAVKWSEQLGNERDAKGFAAMLADFDSALESKP